MTPKQQTAYWKKYARQNAKYERFGVRLFDKAIQEAIRPVIAEVYRNGTQNPVQTVERYFDQRAIERAYTRFYLYVGTKHKDWADSDLQGRIGAKAAVPELDYKEDDRGRSRTQTQTSFGMGFYNPEWLQRLNRLVTGFEAAQRVSQVSQTIKNKLRDVLGKAVQEELSPRRIAKRLREETGGIFSRKRAEVIARTETTYVANLAAEQSATETATAVGLQLVKLWIATADSRTRDSHRAMLGKKPIDKNAKFMVGGRPMDKPGDPAGGASNTVNCRCAIAYFPKDDYEDLFV